MQLKSADVLKGRCLRGSLQKCREPLAAADVAPLRARTGMSGFPLLLGGKQTFGELPENDAHDPERTRGPDR